jgi:RNA polymerase sigma factor (sigma-70 family)
MMDDTPSNRIQRWLDRGRDGDRAARDELLAYAMERLCRLTRKMLAGYPGVRRWEDTDDVLQNALLRLCRALEEVHPESAREFFQLAALQIRRELIDMARRYSGPHGLGANHASRDGMGGSPGGDGDSDDTSDWPDGELADSTHDPGRLAEWTEFHRHVDGLPEDVRAVVDLVFYQGLTAAEAAKTLGVSERTVKRRWQSARLSLQRTLRS